LAASQEVTIVPLRVHWDGEVFRDRADLPTSDFYRLLRSRRSVPTTASPAPDDFERTYRDLLEDADSVISLHLGSKLSATYSVAQAAAERVGQGRVSVIDCGQISLCLGWAVERAVDLAAAGADRQTIDRQVCALLPRLRLYATLDTLEWLQRGGRIGRLAGLAGSLLSIKPVLQVRDGEVLPVERVRTRAAALRRLREIAAHLDRPERLGVIHGDAAAEADQIRRQLEGDSPGMHVDQGEISAVIGVHAGPGVVGVTCLLRECHRFRRTPGLPCLGPSFKPLSLEHDACCRRS